MRRSSTLIAAGAAVALAVAAGFGLGRITGKPGAPPAQQPGRQALYWYDPMYPAQHFDHPGKSPYMDMQLQPKYPGEAAADGVGVRIDPAPLQNLGVRLATIQRGTL